MVEHQYLGLSDCKYFRTWNGDLDELEEHLEKIEIYAEDEGMTETAKELFVAAHHIIEAFRKEE